MATILQLSPGLWKHEDNYIVFSLVADNFAIKYTSKENMNHLLQDLKDKYEISFD